MTSKGPHGYVCPAMATHYGTRHDVARWRKREQEARDRAVASKVQAHDDYMAGMRLFRATAAILRGRNDDFVAGYQTAIMDMDRALMDAIREREASE